MSVDYYQCDKCEESVYSEEKGECGGYTRGCGKTLCTSCLVNDDLDERYAYYYGIKFDASQEQMEEFKIKDINSYKLGDIIDDSGIDPKYCPYCSGKEVHDDDVLNFLLKRYELDIEDVKKEIRNAKS
jgi:hypothetical protein